MPTAKETRVTRPLVQIGDDVREMTDEEYDQHKIDLANIEAALKEQIQKQEAKQVLLTKLGLTEDEAKLLLS